MGLREALGNDPGGGDDSGMSKIISLYPNAQNRNPLEIPKRFGELTKTRIHTSESLGNTLEERYVRLAMLANHERAQIIVTLGLAKGWRFTLLPDDHIDLWAPATEGRPVTWRLRNAELWRAIKKRGVSLT